jgi:hypothetical protein
MLRRPRGGHNRSEAEGIPRSASGATRDNQSCGKAKPVRGRKHAAPTWVGRIQSQPPALGVYAAVSGTCGDNFSAGGCGTTTPQVMIIFIAASTDISSSTICRLGTITRYPAVAFSAADM